MKMSTITPEQEQAIADYLSCREITVGRGSEESACSIAAINLALTGRLTDEIPPCMSPVIGRWIIVVQDAMPHAMRNGGEWAALLPLAAGTGQAHESQRLAIVLDWMWEVVLPAFQPKADAGGYGAEWRSMCAERSEGAAAKAAAAAWAATWAAKATREKEAATWAEWAEWAAAWAAKWAARAAKAEEAEEAAEAAAATAWAAKEAARKAEDEEAAWAAYDPIGLLRRLIAVSVPLAEDLEGAE